jgi:hypothetical protein
VKLKTLVLAAAFAPLLAAVVGSGLAEHLQCEFMETAGPNPYVSCKQLRAIEPALTFFTVYCGWTSIFTVPAGLIALLVLALRRKRE